MMLVVVEWLSDQYLLKSAVRTQHWKLERQSRSTSDENADDVQVLCLCMKADNPASVEDPSCVEASGRSCNAQAQLVQPGLEASHRHTNWPMEA